VDLSAYLEESEFIDWRQAGVLAHARGLAAGADDTVEIARRCFLFVRDEIKHSWDYRLNPVTCRASEVLRHGTGYCYAKSHLLAALLRANGIPAGLCYQRLSAGESGPPYCLHGLNAVWLDGHGWYRIDARGNKPGIDAQFSPPVERLAFRLKADESDLPGVFSSPQESVVRVLTGCTTVAEVYQNLPDLDTFTPAGAP